MKIYPAVKIKKQITLNSNIKLNENEFGYLKCGCKKKKNLALLITANEARGHFYLHFIKIHNEEISNAAFGGNEVLQIPGKGREYLHTAITNSKSNLLTGNQHELEALQARAGSCPVTFKDNFLNKVLTAVELGFSDPVFALRDIC